MSAGDSSAVAHMSALDSASSVQKDIGSGQGRPMHPPKYSASMAARCLTRPSRLVPEAVIGMRWSRSESPSSFQSTVSRCEVR